MRYKVKVSKADNSASKVWALFAMLLDAEDFARTLRRELPYWTVEVIELKNKR